MSVYFHSKIVTAQVQSSREMSMFYVCFVNSATSRLTSIVLGLCALLGIGPVLSNGSVIFCFIPSQVAQKIAFLSLPTLFM